MMRFQSYRCGRREAIHVTESTWDLEGDLAPTARVQVHSYPTCAERSGPPIATLAGLLVGLAKFDVEFGYVRSG